MNRSRVGQMEGTGKRYECVLMSYAPVVAFRVMVDTDQLNIQYHNYSKSWCNVFHMESSINLRTLRGTKTSAIWSI